MKRFLLPALLLLAASLTTAEAQVHFGVKAGLNMSDFLGDDEVLEGTEPRLGLVAGAFAQFPLSPSFAIQPEVLYSMKGITSEASAEEVNLEGKIAVNYIEIPVLAKFLVPLQSGLNLSAYAGPAVAFKVSEEVELAGEGGSIRFDTDVFKSTDFGAAFGGTVGAGAFDVDLRYTLGLVNIVAEQSDAEDFLDDTLRNGVFSVSASWTFGR